VQFQAHHDHTVFLGETCFICLDNSILLASLCPV